MSDYGILITQPGVGTTDAADNEVMLNTSYPMFKLDTQNDGSFHTVLLTLVHDPPEPSGAGTTYTVVYKYKHGLSYRPTIETLFQITVPPPGTSFSTPYYLDFTVLARQTSDDEAYMYAVADDTWVYYIVGKFNDGGGSANLLTGTTIVITTHAFLDGVNV